MGIKIRAQHDISSEYLAAISDQLYEYNQRITGKRDVRGLSFVALDGDDVVGAATGYSWGGIAELEVLWVDEGHRGAGLGTRLLAEFVGEAALRDTRRVWALEPRLPGTGALRTVRIQARRRAGGLARGPHERHPVQADRRLA